MARVCARHIVDLEKGMTYQIVSTDKCDICNGIKCLHEQGTIVPVYPTCPLGAKFRPLDMTDCSFSVADRSCSSTCSEEEELVRTKE